MFSVQTNQEKLLVNITTPFGSSDVIVKSFEWKETISNLFEGNVIFSAKNNALDAEKALKANVNVVLKSETQERYYDGIITEFSQGATQNKNDIYLTEYSITIKPKLWLLTLDKNYLIFQKKSAVDIIKKVLKDQGVNDIDDKTKSCGKKVREYCVQYGESSFNFISRLMEDEGIFYFFKHEKNKHTLVLADSSSAHSKVSGTSKIGFIQSTNDVFPLGKVFNTSMTASANTGGYSLADYNYTLSQTKLFNKLDTKWKGPMFYEYPGGFGKAKEGEDLSKMRVQLFEFNHSIFVASSTAANLVPGFSFEVTDHHVSKFNKEYIVLEVEHYFEFSKSSGFIYRNKFRAFPKGTECRPLRNTPKPRIYGTQTAIVTGPSGEEIFRNEHCCVKVHFHWDQIGKKADTDNSSCWIRVAQVLAGSGWGGVFVPRVGQEVVMAFVNGDPDLPIVVGCLYNDKYMPPYSDKEAMISALKTVSYKNDKGFNEIRFNDEKDKEEIYVHAQKDVHVEIIDSSTLDLTKGSRTITLQSKDGPANHSLSIKEGNSSVMLEKGKSEVTLKEGNSTVTLGKGNSEVTLKEGNSTVTLDKGDRTVKLSKGNLKYDIKGDYTLTVSGNLTIKVDGDVKIESGKNVTEKSGQNFKMEAGTALSLKGGTDLKGEAGTALSLKSGTDFKGESGTAMTLKAGMNLQASANMNMDLKANMNIAAKANMMVELNGQVSTKVAGTMVEVNGTGMTKVGAPMITIGGGMLQLG